MKSRMTVRPSGTPLIACDHREPILKSKMMRYQKRKVRFGSTERGRDIWICAKRRAQRESSDGAMKKDRTCSWYKCPSSCGYRLNTCYDLSLGALTESTMC